MDLQAVKQTLTGQYRTESRNSCSNSLIRTLNLSTCDITWMPVRQTLLPGFWSIQIKNNWFCDTRKQRPILNKDHLYLRSRIWQCMKCKCGNKWYLVVMRPVCHSFKEGWLQGLCRSCGNGIVSSWHWREGRDFASLTFTMGKIAFLEYFFAYWKLSLSWNMRWQWMVYGKQA